MEVSTDGNSLLVTHRAVQPHSLDLVSLMLRLLEAQGAVDAGDLVGLAPLVDEATRARRDNGPALRRNISAVPDGSHPECSLVQLDYGTTLPCERDTRAGDLERPQAPDWCLLAELGVGDGVCGQLECDNCHTGLLELADVARVYATTDAREDIGHGRKVGEGRDRHGTVVFIGLLHLFLLQPLSQSGCLLGVLVRNGPERLLSLLMVSLVDSRFFSSEGIEVSGGKCDLDGIAVHDR